MINVEQIISEKYPSFMTKPAPLRRPTLYFLRRLFHESEVNSFLEKHRHCEGFEFIDRVLDYFNFSYSLSNTDRLNIPSSGRVVIIANHPLGALDGLALIKLVGEVRRDVKIIANDMLANFAPLAPVLLPVDNISKATHKQDIANINAALRNEEAVIVFPAGEVSRAGLTGIKDSKWNSGFMRFARQTNSPVLPVYIGGKNSPLFYSLSMLNRGMSSALLPHEMFNKQSAVLPIKVGEPVAYSQIDGLPVNNSEKVKLIKRHLYRIAKGKKPLFITEKTINHPQDRQALKQELRDSELLGETSDGKKIFLFDYRADSAVINEIGRLREIAFRRVGEGTGERTDLDNYDPHYRHLILWDDDDLEIVGAYRLAEAWRTEADNPGHEHLYSASLFDYKDAMQPYFSQGIELGRSFVQPKYWGKRSLDYLWYGIGAYLKRHPQVRYMFGPVSLSNTYPKAAKDMLVYFYRLYFPDTENLGNSQSPYQLDAATEDNMRSIFAGDDYKEDFKTLKHQLDFCHVAVPTLYKQYADVCREGGVRFLDFGVDADFNYCVDGLVLVDMHYLKDKKRQRYMGDTTNSKSELFPKPNDEIKPVTSTPLTA
ncbi:lysophospholipid acyltransferase family protein [Aliamphritea ceti]|uniref:lysophospholipid acyltransferase family protein n=1 Tax=Aliamphritea ceti TaxID=1524258 RepID=UPI0021C45E14|nr:lysophospholipid acyltransferase family protein [Aliamphritea ceti]